MDQNRMIHPREERRDDKHDTSGDLHANYEASITGLFASNTLQHFHFATARSVSQTISPDPHNSPQPQSAPLIPRLDDLLLW